MTLYRIETPSSNYQVVARDIQTAVSLFQKAYPSKTVLAVQARGTVEIVE